MYNKDFSSYKDLYLKVALENIHILKTNLLMLGKNTHDPSIIENMHRAIHNLKTENALMKYTQLAELCAELENVFLRIKAHQLTLSETFFTLIRDASSHIEKSISHIKSGNKEINLSECINHIKKYLKNI
ncbi:MAG TPA: Hpt domain-containing protein [Patescibacteria group bacterium]|nr:Hpt domain-containing protein [Patescibacteria group bacterium]